MLSVLVDTNIVRDHAGRASAAWKVLMKLAKPGQVLLYLSDVSRREYVTYREQEFDDSIRATRKGLRALRNVCPEEPICGELQTKLNDLMGRRSQVGEAIQRWIDEFVYSVHPSTGDHGVAALNGYFNGDPPFAQVKSRTDFPDALIYQAILELAAANAPLHVITGDKKFAAHVAKIEGVTVHLSLDDFVQTPVFATLVQTTDSIELFLEFIRSPQGTNPDPTVIGAIEQQLAERSVDSFADEAEATINGFGAIRDLVFDSDNLVDYGEGVFNLPFTARSECEVSFFIEKWQYFHVDDDVRPQSVEDWNERVFRVEDTYDLEIKGTLTFEAEPKKTESEATAISSWNEVRGLGTLICELDAVEIADPEIREKMEF